MKKLILLLAIALFGISAAQAQQITAEEGRQVAMDFLRGEGYIPTIDEDDDIFFKLQGYKYWIEIDELSRGGLITYFFVSFSSDESHGKLTEACNTLNKNKNCIKAYVVEYDDGSRSYRITLETINHTRQELINQIKIGLSFLPRCVEDFHEMI